MNNAANALAFMHQIKGFVDFIQAHIMSDKLVDLKVIGQIGVNELWYTFDALPSTESRSLPCAAGHQLEWSRADLLPSCCNANDHGYTPSFACGFLK